MRNADDTAERARFEQEELERCRRGALLACAIGAPIVALFGVYDALFFPEQLGWFLAMRLGVVTCAALAAVALRRPVGRRHTIGITWWLAMLAGFMTVVMAAATGGRASPYYGGVNLVLLGTTLLIPWPARWSLLASGTLIAAYLVAVVVVHPISPPGVVSHNFFFLGTTSALAFASTVAARRLRWREFTTRTALATALEHKRDFLASMTHELRNPLNVVIGYAGMLAERLDGPEHADARELAERIRERGTLVHGMISDLLDAAKIDAGKMTVSPGPVAIAPLVDTLARSFGPLAERKGLALRTRVAAGLPSLVTDAQRLEQILTNLVGNALKFTHEGSVCVGASVAADLGEITSAGFHLLGPPPADGPCVVLSVEDTGIGIRPADVLRLAEDFAQVAEAATGAYGGTGLGLSISRKLARLLHGTLAVRSRYGVGSTFAILLPIAAEPVRDAA